MSLRQLATFKPLCIIKDSLTLCLASWRAVIQAILSVFFLLLTMTLVLVFSPKILALIVTLVVILVFLVSITWLSIVEQLYVRYFKQEGLSWKEGFSRSRQPVYYFTAAILFVDGCAYFAGFFNPILGYVAFSSVAMTTIFVASGQPIIRAIQSTLNLTWQNFVTQLLAFLPLPLVLYLSNFLVKAMRVENHSSGYALAANVAISICIAIIIVWYFALGICLQKHLAPETIADDLLVSKNEISKNKGEIND